MTQLKLLIIDSARYLRDLSSLPTSLKVLHWLEYPLKTLPLSDQQYELVEIKLKRSHFEYLWLGKKSLGKLTHLDLTGSELLKQTPDLSEVPTLQTLVLKYCESLTEVHPSVVRHKSLTLLDLTGCEKLEALPGKLHMSSLNELILDDCSSFENLPEFGECMKSLSRVSLAWTSIEKLPTTLGCLVGLEDLNLRGCEALKGLPSITDGIPLLRTLNMSSCCLTEASFSPDFGPFPSLTDLDLSWNHFVSIPINIHDIPKLKCLKLNDCRLLECLPELPSSIRKLEACHSPKISKFNILSKVCGGFVSPSQGPSQVLLKMVIPGREIPSWFVDRLPCDYPQNENPGIALYYHVTFDEHFRGGDLEFALGFCNGNDRFITRRITDTEYRENYPHIPKIILVTDFTKALGLSCQFEAMGNLSKYQ